MSIQTQSAKNPASGSLGAYSTYVNTLPLPKTRLASVNFLRVGLILGDAATLLVAFTLAYLLRFEVGIAFERDIVPDEAIYLAVGLVMVTIWLAMISIMGGYNQNLLLGGTGEYSRVVNATTWGAMVVMIYSFFDVEFSISRGWLVLSWVISAVALCSYRFTARRVAYRLRSHGYFVSRSIVVGTNEEACVLAAQLSPRAQSGLQIMGMVQTGQHGADSTAGATLGTLDDLPSILQRTGATEIIVASSAVSREELIRIASLLKGLPDTHLKLSSGLYEVLTTGMEITTPNNVPLMSLNNLRLSRTELFMKSLLDYSVIVIALPVLVPLLAIIALLVRLDSPGPIFHRRRVMGVGGRPFDAFKFRTMAVNGDELLATHPDKLEELRLTHKIKDDPRVTRVGRVLRSLSLDELPQLINVLFGQMSLVGPRMISPDEQQMYGPMRYNLLTVKPGLTGMWQVSGRSDLTYEERVQLDMTYIRNYTIWSDIQILFFQTLPAVFRKTGAY